MILRRIRLFVYFVSDPLDCLDVVQKQVLVAADLLLDVFQVLRKLTQKIVAVLVVFDVFIVHPRQFLQILVDVLFLLVVDFDLLIVLLDCDFFLIPSHSLHSVGHPVVNADEHVRGLGVFHQLLELLIRLDLLQKTQSFRLHVKV